MRINKFRFIIALLMIIFTSANIYSESKSRFTPRIEKAIEKLHGVHKYRYERNYYFFETYYNIELFLDNEIYIELKGVNNSLTRTRKDWINFRYIQRKGDNTYYCYEIAPAISSVTTEKENWQMILTPHLEPVLNCDLSTVQNIINHSEEILDFIEKLNAEHEGFDINSDLSDESIQKLNGYQKIQQDGKIYPVLFCARKTERSISW